MELLCPCILLIVTVYHTMVGCAEDAEGCDGLFVRVFKQLCHKEVIILHSHWELLHVCSQNAQCHNVPLSYMH